MVKIPARERAYDFLKASILAEHFTAGERLTEERVAGELGISRTPIREALQKLASEGLIQPLGTRGFVASRDTREEVEELFEIRSVLEGYALRVIAERIDEPVLLSLEAMIEEAEGALRAGRLDEVYRANTRFHDTLHGLIADKRRLYDQMVNMRKYVLRYRHGSIQYRDGGRRTIEGHRRIMLALRLRDADLCERIMRDHILASGRDALQFLFSSKES